MNKLSLILFNVLLAPTVALPAAEKPGSASRPNFVIFIADDLTWHDVACFGGPTDAKTPNLDRLAGEGMKLTGFYSPVSVCSPTRQALLTGMYPIRSGAYPNHSQVKPGTRSLPYHLKPLGYRTACAGKTHFGPETSYPFDKMIRMIGETGRGSGEDAGNGELSMQAIEKFITEDERHPFCLYVATHESHAPWTKGDRSAYDPAKLKIPPYLVDTPETRGALSAYYAVVTYMDAEVGTLLRLLEKTGHGSDTLFLFVSEQGSSVPHGKWTLYDPGIRVAAIARWPGKVKPGSENGALVQYVDVLPTLLEAAGASPAAVDTGCPDANGNHGFDGRSFLDVLLGKSTHVRDYVFAEHTTRGIIRGSEAYAIQRVRAATGRIEAASSNKNPASSDWALRKQFPITDQNPATFRWAAGDTPIMARGLVLAGDTVFAAGPPNLVNDEEAFKNPDDPAIRAKLDAQVAALKGQKGSQLLALAAADGKKLAAYQLESMPTFDGMAAGKGKLFLTTLSGKVICLGSNGTALPAAPEANLAPLDISIHPAPPAAPAAAPTKAKAKGKGKGKGAAKVAAPTGPLLNDEFVELKGANVTASELGYRVFVEGGSMGWALKKLPAPLAGKVDLKVRMKLGAGSGLQNGFLVFGETAEEAGLVQCGLRAAMKKAFVAQGPITGSAVQSGEADIIPGKVQEIAVSVALDSGQVTMTTGATTVRATLPRRLGAISYVGYGTINAVTDFSLVEASAR